MINIIVLFYILLILSAISLLVSDSPLHSVLFLICLFIIMSIILIYLNISFLGLLILIVYVGAIAILFLYIVMMLNLKQINNNSNNKTSILGFVVIILFLIVFLKFMYVFNNIIIPYIPKYLNTNIDMHLFSKLKLSLDSLNQLEHIKQIGLVLFTYFFLCVLYSGVLLLVSMIGAIVLTNNKKGYSMRIQYNFSYRFSNVYLLN